jgi:hypothetical protein
MPIDAISPFRRGLAITGVFVENYLSWIGVNAPGPRLVWFIRYVQFFGASLVHIFFVLSGYGIVRKYQACSDFPWKAYAANRFEIIVVPYWIVVTASYLFISLLHGWDPGTFGAQFGPTDLLAYPLFMRNFNVSSWGLSSTLWFIQAIFGLYVLFPFLLALQKTRAEIGFARGGIPGWRFQVYLRRLRPSDRPRKRFLPVLHARIRDRGGAGGNSEVQQVAENRRLAT